MAVPNRAVYKSVLQPTHTLGRIRMRTAIGGIAQWLEQSAHNRLVPGSSPGTPTIKTPPNAGGFFI